MILYTVERRKGGCDTVCSRDKNGRVWSCIQYREGCEGFILCTVERGAGGCDTVRSREKNGKV